MGTQTIRFFLLQRIANYLKSLTLLFFKRNLLAWRHLQTSSNLLFKSSFWFWEVTISSFSYKHKRHFFEISEYGGTHLKTDHRPQSISNCSSILPLQVLDALFWQWYCYVAFINYVVNLAVPFDRTLCFFSAIAFWSLVTWFQCDFSIMSLDDFWRIVHVHASVADFNCTVDENIVNFGASLELFCYQLKECICCFRLYIWAFTSFLSQ